MSQPITVEATGFSAAGAYCTLQAYPVPLTFASNTRYTSYLLEDITWTVNASSTVAANFTCYWVLQELGHDNIFRTIRFPAGNFIYANATWSGKLEGRVLGIQLLMVNSLGSGNISYARISATIRGGV